METRDRLFIGNEWVAPATERTIDVISPITEEVYRARARRDARPTSTAPSPPRARRSTTARSRASTPEERADAIAALSRR